MSGEPRNADPVVGLRQAFDSQFAVAPSTDVQPHDDLLDIHIGPATYLLRLRELSRLAPMTKVAPLPSRARALIGIAAVGGTVVPVYDLRVLLGHAAPAETSPRWLVLPAGAPVALAFDAVVGHLRVSSATIIDESPDRNSAGHVRAVVMIGGQQRLVLSTASLIAEISRLVGETQVKGVTER